MSNQRIHVAVFQTGKRVPLREFVLNSGESHKSQIALGKMVISDDSGNELFQKAITIEDANEVYHSPGRRELHLILTDKGAYPIPHSYWNNWRAHLEEILRDSSSTNRMGK